jgi:Mrp family chromosome partitioning ATPase
MTDRAGMSEAFDPIRERILSAGRDLKAAGGAIAVVLTARRRGDGVTTIAIGLARSFARTPHCRVLVIDHDAVEGGVAARLDVAARTLDPAPAGRPAPSARDVILPVASAGFDLLTLGPGHARALPDEPPWEPLLTELRSAYDVILVDAGSLERHVPLGWGRWADQTILVVDTTSTTVETLDRLKADLKYWAQPLTGVILNKRRLPVPDALYRRFR